VPCVHRPFEAVYRHGKTPNAEDTPRPTPHSKRCIAMVRHPTPKTPRAKPLQPAALCCDQDRLRAVDGAELAVDVVQVGAYGAGGERQLVSDLLVDLALG
jgi:hypothetical protein